jgi:hypothetical protein
VATSGNCKKIAVYCGSGKVYIRNPECAESVNSADNLFQQMYPTNTWGKKYITVSSENNEVSDQNNIYRIVKSDPSVVVTLDGNILPNSKFINGFYYEFFSKGTHVISGDKPILVAQYFPTEFCYANGNPGDPEMNAKVNNAVKFREGWRPFAPSFKKEAAPEYLESAYDSPFMILTAQVRPEKRSMIPSVTHVDGSARPQTVEREINPLYYRLIDEFGKLTGVPVIMNTSFNLRGEAIVHTPTDAIRTFFSSGMDALVIGGFLVEK